MPSGSPFLSGLFEGFNNAREENAQQNLKADADSRAQEAKVYQYLLQSQDPEISGLALSGMMESARPGTRKKGLRGWLGEVQGGDIWPQIKARMNELVPEDQPPAAAPTGPAAPTTPGSAALPSTTPVKGGPTAAPAGPTGQPAPAVAPSGGGVAGGPSAAPSAPAPPANSGLVGAPPPGPPLALGPAAGAPPTLPSAPPDHPLKRRGTGIPTAEEIADAAERRKMAETTQTQQAETDRQLAVARQSQQFQNQEIVRNLYIKTADGKGPFPAFQLRGSTGGSPLLVFADGSPVPRDATEVSPAELRPPTKADPMATLLTPSEVASFNDPRIHYGMTRGDAANLGLRVHTPQDRIRLSAIDSLVPQVNRLETLLNQALPAAGSGLRGEVSSSLALGKQKLQGLSSYRELQGLLATMRTPVAKIIATDPSRVSVQEQQRVQQMLPDIDLASGWFPHLADSPDAARDMVQQIRGAIDDAKTAMGEPPIDWSHPSVSSGAASAAAAPKKDDVRQVQGKWMRITQVYPDGTFDADPITPAAPPLAPMASHAAAPPGRP